MIYKFISLQSILKFGFVRKHIEQLKIAVQLSLPIDGNVRDFFFSHVYYIQIFIHTIYYDEILFRQKHDLKT